VLQQEYADPVAKADSFLVLGCGQGVHTVIDATEGGMVHPGCDTIFGGETVSAENIEEYCSLCGECIIEFTGGLCPMTLCSKQLLNGPCGGAEKGCAKWTRNALRLGDDLRTAETAGAAGAAGSLPEAQEPCQVEPAADIEGQRNRSHEAATKTGSLFCVAGRQSDRLGLLATRINRYKKELRKMS
jgi:hypothetical protein